MLNIVRHPLIGWLWLAGLAVGLLWVPYSLVNEFSRVQASQLSKVRDAGVLRVLTLNGPTTYFKGPTGWLGFEYDLAGAFADHLGVELEVVTASYSNEILPRLAAGEADFAAAGIVVTTPRKRLVHFSAPYQTVDRQVIFRREHDRPANKRGLLGRDLVVITGTDYVEALKKLQEHYPTLEWDEMQDMSLEELLIELWQGLHELTIADSHLVSVVRQYYPELHVAFTLSRGHPLAWAFRRGGGTSLAKAATEFIRRARKSGELDRLLERYYDPAVRAQFPNVTAFQRRVQNTLPEYVELFREASQSHDLDWRLLAAQAYQESLWDPKAVSPTGVRGIMMLTNDTARLLKIQDRQDPWQSIEGGARYLRQLLDGMPETVELPDRTWFALAAYNVGAGHLEDARVITARQGGDPNRWTDVKKNLPLLAKPAWYRKTRHGYARGREPVQYVTRIRSYYNILVKIDEDEKAKTKTEALEVVVPAI